MLNLFLYSTNTLKDGRTGLFIKGKDCDEPELLRKFTELVKVLALLVFGSTGCLSASFKTNFDGG